MGYTVQITDEGGRPIPGTISFYDAQGKLMGTMPLALGGTTIPDQMVAAATTFHVDSPGYVGYDVLELDPVNVFPLVLEPTHPLPIILVLLGAFVAIKLLKL